MAKMMWRTRLRGYTINDELAKYGKEVAYFESEEGGTHITVTPEVVTVVSEYSSEEYLLYSHTTIKNLWLGKVRGNKAHFSKKVLVAELRYWA